MFDCDLYDYTRLLIGRDKAKPGSDLQNYWFEFRLDDL